MIGIGSTINNKYQLTRLLGDGGMGSVYEGRHLVLGTRVAIKVLHPELTRRPGLVDRFLQEARLAAQIRSPHVVQVTDVDRTAEGHAYIVMELLEGEPLSAVLDRQRRLATLTACDYTLQVLTALEAAHALGIVHRDLKPENVFVTFSAGKPVLKLIDFGIAKARRTDPQQKNLTVAGVVMGTAEYMAPEQARNAGQVDVRADLYAVGVLLYEMISGARPVAGDDARLIALMVERGEVIPLVKVAPDAPRELAGLVHRAMAARPELRFATATDMRLALEKAMTARSPSTVPPVPQGIPSATSTNVSNYPPASQLPASHVPASQYPQASQYPAQTRAPARATPIAELSGPGLTGPGMDIEPAVSTERSPPVGSALPPRTQTPAYNVGVAVPPPQQPSRERQSGRNTSRTLAMIALPVVVCAGAVMILAATGRLPHGGDPTPPRATATATATAWTDDSDAGANMPPTVDTVPAGPGTLPTLVPTHPIGPGPGPGPGPHPSGRRPQRGPDAGVGGGDGPPPLFPSVLPPFSLPPGLPSVFPWPGMGGPPGEPPPGPPPGPGGGSI